MTSLVTVITTENLSIFFNRVTITSAVVTCTMIAAHKAVRDWASVFFTAWSHPLRITQTFSVDTFTISRAIHWTGKYAACRTAPTSLTGTCTHGRAFPVAHTMSTAVRSINRGWAPFILTRISIVAFTTYTGAVSAHPTRGASGASSWVTLHAFV